MDKIRYRLVYNRQKRLNAQGKALVQAEAYLNRRKTYFTTKVYLYPHEWDKKTTQVVNTRSEHDLNAFLYEFIIRLQTIELNFWKRGIQCTLSLLREEHAKNRPIDMSFHSFANRAIDDSNRRQSTKDNLKTTLAALNDFRKGVDFKDLTYSFVKEFEVWLKSQNKALNTVAKHLRQLRTLINEAINEGYMKQEEYPFRKFKIKKEQGKHTFLMPDELRRLEALEPEEPRQKHILDAFLFCIYSGLRYSDFKSLKDENIIAIRGQKWLQLKMQKTNIEIRSPLYLLFEGKALDIIGRYKKITDLAGIGDNCNVNRILKGVLAKARIKKEGYVALCKAYLRYVIGVRWCGYHHRAKAAWAYLPTYYPNLYGRIF